MGDMKYQRYRATVTLDEGAGIFHGEVINTRDVITFQGKSVGELRSAFRDSVDEYLKLCAERGRTPDKPFSGKVPLRIAPEVHRAATAAASAEGKSLNTWLSETIERAAGQA